MKFYLVIVVTMLSVLLASAQESRFVQTADGILHYQLIGEGKTVLIINGGPGFSSEGFLNIAKEIASMGYRTILFDQRGTGKSTLEHVNASNITMALMARDMELIRKELGLKDWVLFGHSFGGMLANYYTALHPNSVSAIIHSSSGGLDLQLLENARDNLYSRLSQQEIDSLTYWRRKVDQENSPYNRENYTRFLASAYVYDKKYIPVVSERLMQGDMSINRMVWQDMVRMEFDCKEALRTFNKPVLIIQGKQDIIPEALALTASSVFRNSTVNILNECGHYGWLDQEEAYLGAIKSFLERVKKYPG
ncbi:MAG: alpha/beta hydrolase [Flavobacteriaceae bacterium]|nr:alpha/beta hydrolase [Flavobacteriaceae bacterium]